MRRTLNVLAVTALTATLAAASAASASVTIADNYFGGNNTYNGQDVIGESLFDVQSATFARVGAGGNSLQVTINTNYAGAPGTGPADGTGYGALFLTAGANSWHPTGVAPYPTDVYKPGEWTYAFTIPQVPDAGDTSGSANLYATADGSVVMSNVYGDTITAPYAGNPGYYFRAGQAVQFNAGVDAVSLASGTWAVDPGKIVFTIADNHLLGDDLSFSWGMTCGNDVIQGQVDGVPEASTWALMLAGFGGLGAALRRRRAMAVLAAA